MWFSSYSNLDSDEDNIIIRRMRIFRPLINNTFKVKYVCKEMFRMKLVKFE